MAEREGFEPSVELPPHILSRDAQSAALSSLQRIFSIFNLFFGVNEKGSGGVLYGDSR